MLELRGLHTKFNTKAGVVHAVNGVSLTLQSGEILGLVGESGSGKTVTGFSIMGLLKPTSGEILFNNRDLLKLSQTEMRKLRGKEIAMIFQDPVMTLNPVLSIETQMIEAYLAHENVPRDVAYARCIEVLEQLSIAAPHERIKAYPHQFSGGMRQRVAIAIAFLNKPSLIIADEPTTALDVTIQSQILVEVQKLTRENNSAMIWVTHDLGLVSQLADKIAVMYAGSIVEMGSVSEVLLRPRHPYTLGLLRSLPARNERGKPLFQIEGQAPRLTNMPLGCAFAPRCFQAKDKCHIEAPVLKNDVSCHFPIEVTP